MNERIVWSLLLIVAFYSVVNYPILAEGNNEEAGIGNLLKKIEAAYIGMNDYRCILLSKKDNGDEESMEYFFKKPKQIRMELITPRKGAILTYRSGNSLVYVSPFSWFRRLVLSFRLDNPMVMSGNGHRVDESDIGSFIDTILKPAIINGEASLIDEIHEIPNSYLIKIDLKDEVRGRPNKFKVWIDKKFLLPVRIDSYYPDWKPLESVTFRDLTINSGPSDDIFRLKR